MFILTKKVINEQKGEFTMIKKKKAGQSACMLYIPLVLHVFMQNSQRYLPPQEVEIKENSQSNSS